MPNIRNDSTKVEEAHRQADIIFKALPGFAGFASKDTHYAGDARYAIANALLDIWQVDYDLHLLEKEKAA